MKMSGTAAAVAGGLAVGVAILAVVFGLELGGPGGPGAPGGGADAGADTTAATGADAGRADAGGMGAAATGGGAATVAPAVQVAPQNNGQDANEAPQFQTLRVDGSGLAVVSGRSRPGDEVALVLNGEVLATVVADESGEFALIESLPPSAEPVMASLRVMRDGAAISSPQSYTVAPQGGAAPASVQTAATQGADDMPDATLSGATASGDTPEGAEMASPQAPAVLRSDASGVTVVQPATGDGANAPEVMASVALDAISYSDAGEVALQGRASGEGFVRIYLDNAPVTTSRIAPGGQWRTELPQVDRGTYTLRVDEVDSEGRVTSRVETPFLREDRETLARAQAAQAVADAAAQSGGSAGQGASPPRAITVQPGNTLWAIARDSYGEGLMYVRLYEANRDRIRNPDLIYPGQVFDLPQ